eukprot:2340195-Alexandrium_andersonii.AAC.1
MSPVASGSAAVAGSHEPKQHMRAHALTFYARRGKLKGRNAHGSTTSQVAMQASNCALRAAYQQATVCVCVCCELRRCEQPYAAS